LFLFLSHDQLFFSVSLSVFLSCHLSLSVFLPFSLQRLSLSSLFHSPFSLSLSLSHLVGDVAVSRSEESRAPKNLSLAVGSSGHPCLFSLPSYSFKAASVPNTHTHTHTHTLMSPS